MAPIIDCGSAPALICAQAHAKSILLPPARSAGPSTGLAPAPLRGAGDPWPCAHRPCPRAEVRGAKAGAEPQPASRADALAGRAAARSERSRLVQQPSRPGFWFLKPASLPHLSLAMLPGSPARCSRRARCATVRSGRLRGRSARTRNWQFPGLVSITKAARRAAKARASTTGMSSASSYGCACAGSGRIRICAPSCTCCQPAHASRPAESAPGASVRRSSAAGRADPAQRADFEGHAAKVGPQGLDHCQRLAAGAGSHGADPAGTAITTRPWARFQIRANSNASAASSSFAAAKAGAGAGAGAGVGAGFSFSAF